MDAILENGINNGNAPEGERPEPFAASSQSPGDPEPYFMARAVAGVIVLGLDVAVLDLFTDPMFRLNPTANLAKAVIAFAEKYKRTPTVREYDAIRRDVTDASIAEDMNFKKDPDRARAFVENAILRVTEYVDDWEELPEDECQPIVDSIMLDVDKRRMRQALLDAREAMDRNGGLEEARDILTKFVQAAPTEAGARPFAPISAVEMTAGQAEPPTPWLWRPYLAAGMFGILTGYAKIGKDTFAWPLAIAISRGYRFLGMETTKTPVLFLAIEDSARTVRRRLRAEGMLPDDTDLYVWPYPMKASSLPEIKRFMVERKIGLLVISTLARWWNVENENDAAEVERAAEPLLDLARDTESAVLVVHHDGKSEEARSSRGSSALPALVDLHLSLKRASKDPADPTRKLTVEGQREEDAVPEPG